MKTFIRLVFLGVIAVTFSCNKGPGEEEINKYMDEVALQENNVLQRLNDLIDAYDAYNNNTDDIENAYKKVYEQLDKSEKALDSLKGFDDDDILKPSAKKFLQDIKSLMDNEHKRILELYRLPEDQFKEKQEKELENLRDTANKKSDTIMSTAEAAFQKFEDKYSGK